MFTTLFFRTPFVFVPSALQTVHIDLPDILSGETITDRKSTFQAHVARVHSKEQVSIGLFFWWYIHWFNKVNIGRTDHGAWAYVCANFGFSEWLPGKRELG